RFDQRLQNRTQIESRPADHFQNVGSCRLLLQRLPQFLEQPRILDRDHRLIGKSAGEFDLFVCKRFNAGTVDDEDADERVLTQERNAKHRAVALNPLSFQVGVFRILQHVTDLNRPALQLHTRAKRASIGRQRMRKEKVLCFVWKATRRHHMVALVESAEHYRLFGAAEPRHRLHQRVEYRLEVGGGTADDLEHVAGRGQLVHRARQFGLAVAQLTQEPRILHRDDCLGGEALEQRDFLLGKGTNVPSGCGDLAEQPTLLAQRNEQYGPDTAEFKGGTENWILDLGAVGDLGEARAFQQRQTWVVRARGEALMQPIGERLSYPVHRDRAELLAVIKLKAPVADPEKPVSIFQDRLEYRRKVAG